MVLALANDRRQVTMCSSTRGLAFSVLLPFLATWVRSDKDWSEEVSDTTILDACTSTRLSWIDLLVTTNNPSRRPPRENLSFELNLSAALFNSGNLPI